MIMIKRKEGREESYKYPISETMETKDIRLLLTPNVLDCFKDYKIYILSSILDLV